MIFRTLKKDYYTIGNPINEKVNVISKQLKKNNWQCIKQYNRDMGTIYWILKLIIGKKERNYQFLVLDTLYSDHFG